MDGKVFSRDFSSQSGSSWCHQTGHTRVLSVAINLDSSGSKGLESLAPFLLPGGPLSWTSNVQIEHQAQFLNMFEMNKEWGARGDPWVSRSPSANYGPRAEKATDGDWGLTERRLLRSPAREDFYCVSCLPLRACKQIKQNFRGFLFLQDGMCFLF